MPGATPDTGGASTPAPHAPAAATRAQDGGAETTAALLARSQAALPALAAAALAGGAAFRLMQYLSGRSLWFDESLLALNLMERSFGGLVGELDFGQGAPIAFLFSVKLALVSFGPSEAALRLVPLAAGLAALPLCYVVARRVLPAAAALVAVVLVAVADGLVYYSAELKQYSMDVAVAVALLALALVPGPARSWRRLILLSAAGVAAMWLSHPSIFVLAGIFLALGLDALLRRRREVLRRLAVMSAPVLAGFAAFLFAYQKGLGTLSSQIAQSPDSFARPVQDGGLSVQWARSLFGAYNVLLGLPDGEGLVASSIRALFAALIVVGAVSLLRRRRAEALALGLPIVLMLVASQLGRYPMFARTVIFTLPAIVLFFSAGLVAVAGRFRPRLGLAVGAVLAALVLASPVVTAVRHAAEPRTRQEIEPVLAVLVEQWQPEDVLYVHYGAQPAFRFYAECGCAEGVPDTRPMPLALALPTRGRDVHAPAILPNPPQLAAGRYAGSDWDAYVEEVRQLRGRGRVWILYSHRQNLGEQAFLEQELPRRLDELAVRRAAFEAPLAGLLLYDLSR